jgi:hypothetical protein
LSLPKQYLSGTAFLFLRVSKIVQVCEMKGLFFFSLFLTSILYELPAQIRMEKLVIKTNEIYRFNLETDIIVADTLIMMDSSKIILNALKTENYIRAKVMVFGNSCMIDGRGQTGNRGRKGRTGNTFSGPCQNATNGTNGGAGLSGVPGVTLFLYCDTMIIKGKVIVDLSGGNGGAGGDGGKGGDGSPGTVHCNGGNGGVGGSGGRGGDGGHGGNLIVNSIHNDQIKSWLGKKFIFRSMGGYMGQGGRMGYSGSAGLGPSRRNGKDGAPGADGVAGKRGANGLISFESK